MFAECPSIDVYSFLRQSHGNERFYWSEPINKPNRLTMAGTGIAAEIIVPPALRGNDIIQNERSKSRFAVIADQACDLFADSVIE